MLCLLTFAGACGQEKSSDVPPSPTQPVKGTEATQAPAADTAPRLLSLTEYFPANTFVIAYMDVGALTTPTVDALLSFFGPHFSMVEKAALYKELSDFFVARLGINPMQLEWVAVAVSDDQRPDFAGIISGSFDVSKLPTVDIDGLTIHVLIKDKVGLLPVPGKPGMMFVVPVEAKKKQKALRDNLKARLADPSKSLAKSPHLDGFKALFENETNGAVFSAHLRNGPLITKLMEGSPVEVLKDVEWAAVGVGTEVKITLRGEQSKMQALKPLWESQLSAGAAELKKLKKNVDQLDIAQGAGAILAYHLADPLQKRLMPEFDGEYVRSNMSLDGAAAVGGLGVLAAVAIPAFLKYIRDSKRSEAQENLHAISMGALSYYEEEHVVQGGVVTGQYPQGEVCTTTGNTAGQKQVPDSSEFDKGLWKDLRFNLSRPHYYQYCYTGTADHFTATAKATLDSGEMASDSIFTMDGVVQNGRPVVGVPIEQ